MVEVIRQNPILTDEQTKGLAGKLLTGIGRVVTNDADVYCGETGKILAKFRKAVIPQDIQEKAFENLRGAATQNSNRGVSAGYPEAKKINSHSGIVIKDNNVKFKRILKDGSVSKTLNAATVQSGIIGFFDRNVRFPNCRQTASTNSTLINLKKPTQ